jgi:hypothetical protein
MGAIHLCYYEVLPRLPGRTGSARSRKRHVTTEATCHDGGRTVEASHQGLNHSEYGVPIAKARVETLAVRSATARDT